jgi:hypothetical protein
MCPVTIGAAFGVQPAELLHLYWEKFHPVFHRSAGDKKNEFDFFMAESYC